MTDNELLQAILAQLEILTGAKDVFLFLLGWAIGVMTLRIITLRSSI